MHIRIAVWLGKRVSGVRVLKCFRGGAKSTMLAVYNAWRYLEDCEYRILHQGDRDPTAYKTARDTKNVLMHHPLTAHLRAIRGQTSFWWVPGSTDYRNPSMQATGILSGITSSRADEIQCDDVEVPKNIRTAESRLMLRHRISEHTHILVPGGRVLFCGTPHTHECIYDEEIEGGADSLEIPLFARHKRLEDGARDTNLTWRPSKQVIVMCGIWTRAYDLKDGVDYVLSDNEISFIGEHHGVIDVYDGNAWPRRFDTNECIRRRRRCRTLNEWDSQYQLQARPLHEIRLDPDLLVPYDVRPRIDIANGETRMMLGFTRIVGCSAWWDTALGKLTSDDSVLCSVLTDDAGRLYWHRAVELIGDIYSQAATIRECVLEDRIPCVTVETNGPGGFVPPILRKELAGTGCAVREVQTTGAKNQRILDGLEAPLSGKFLWAHVDVIDRIRSQMRDWNPALSNQPDDYLDAGAEAIKQTPVRIGRIIGEVEDKGYRDWRPSSGVHTVEFVH